MSAPIRTLVAVDDAFEAGGVHALIGDPGIDIVGVVAAEPDAVAAHPEADVLVVACEGDSSSALQLISRAVTERPDRPVIVVYRGAQSGFVRKAFECGADDFVRVADPATAASDTFFAIEKALARKTTGVARDGKGRENATVVCVLGPKGGVGKTLSSANLTAALAASGKRVVGVDLDLQFGDLGLALGIPPERTIDELVTAGGVLDPEKIEAFLSDGPGGCKLLAAPVRPDQAALVTVEFLRELFAVLGTCFEYVVIDTPPAFTPEVIVSVDAATNVLMVGMLDAPSLKNTKIGLETLELMGYPRERVKLLLNRADSNVGVTQDDVREVIGSQPDILVPSGRDVVRSVNAGEPIVLSRAKSPQAKAYRQLADIFIEQREAMLDVFVDEKPARKRVLSLRRG